MVLLEKHLNFKSKKPFHSGMCFPSRIGVGNTSKSKPGIYFSGTWNWQIFFIFIRHENYSKTLTFLAAYLLANREIGGNKLLCSIMFRSGKFSLYIIK